LYREAAAGYGAALDRLASAYEANPEERRDLLQDIHVGLWRSFSAFDGRCSLRTWVYRVAHNIATSHVIRQRRKNSVLVTLEAIEAMPDDAHGAGAQEHTYARNMSIERLMALIHQLKPLDRQMMLLYLEGMDAASIGEVMGVSAGNVATKIHRIKNILTRRFHGGERDAG
jgi:RNA polymerase sigma-70 factor (ECF subfamily)